MSLHIPTLLAFSIKAWLHNRAHSVRACPNTFIAVVCILIVALTGCRQPVRPVSYEELCGLPSSQMGVMSEEEVRWWMEKKYGMAKTVNLEEFLPPTGGSVTAYGWREEDESGDAYLRDGRLFRISRESKNGPTLGQVVAGLGPPEMFARSGAMYGGHVIAFLQLDYLELGVSVGTWREMTPRELSGSYEKWTVILREDMQVSSIFCYLPQLSLEEVLKDILFIRPEGIPRAMNERMSWPGFGARIPLFVPGPASIPVPTNTP